MHRVGLDHLAHVHQLAQQLGRARRLDADDHVASFGRHQVVADRADAADARGDGGHFKEHAPLAEFLKATELVDVQVCMFDLSRVVHVDRHPGVAFNTGYGFDGDFLTHKSLLFLYL